MEEVFGDRWALGVGSCELWLWLCLGKLGWVNSRNFMHDADIVTCT